MKPKLDSNYTEFIFSDPNEIEDSIKVKCRLNSDKGDYETPPYIDLDYWNGNSTRALDEDTLKFMLAAINKVKKLIKEEK